jgi:acylphosphatase
MSEAQVERRGWRVAGRVQGVGFRWSTVRAAREAGLRGSVRNAADGSVEVVAEGATAALDRLERWLGEGPPGARVEGVERTEVGLPIPEEGFVVV